MKLDTMFHTISRIGINKRGDQLSRQVSSMLCMMDIDHRIVPGTSISSGHISINIEAIRVRRGTVREIGPRIEIFGDGSHYYDRRAYINAEDFPWDKLLEYIDAQK